MGTIKKKKWLKKKRRSQQRKKATNIAKSQRRQQFKAAGGAAEEKVHPRLNQSNPFMTWSYKPSETKRMPANSSHKGLLCLQGRTEGSPGDEIELNNGVVGTVVGKQRDNYGNVIGVNVEVPDIHKVMSGMIGKKDLRPEMRWRDKVLSFDGNKATFTWDENGCVFEAETDLEPCVLGKVESLTDDELVFRTDFGKYRVEISGKSEADELLHNPRFHSKTGYSRTLQKMFNKSLQKWGMWAPGGIWKASSLQACPDNQKRPRWRVSKWFHPEHGAGTYNSRGNPVRS